MEVRISPTRLRPAVLGLFLVLLVSSAWMHDDAYITFRTVDNFLAGLGLTWNPVERVQAYTHPLWMLLHAALFAVTREAYFTNLAFSMALSTAVVYLLLYRLPAPAGPAAVTGFLLISCKSFVEYSTSGLENPLTHLLFLLFALTWLGALDEGSFKTLFKLSLIAALAGVNRPDTLLLFLPALGFLVFRHRSVRRSFVRNVTALALGFLPLVLWELFSLVYYGFLFPNTAYAKLGIAAPQATVLKQGFHYLLYTLLHDPVTWLVLSGSCYAAVKRRNRRGGLLLAGCGLYLVYVVRIGGDYMGGRFLSAPVLGAAIVLACAEWPRLSRKQALAGLAVLSFCLLRSATAPVTRPWLELPSVGDERLRFYHATGLLNGALSDRPWPNHFFRWKGEHVRRHGPRVVVDAYVGFLGFYAGPNVHVVDLLGLPDPLLARLPGRFPKDGDGAWKPGHVSRPLPEGYLESLESGENRIADPNLAVFYDRLTRVTRGALLSRDRWREIRRFHSGANDTLVEAYVEANAEAFSNPPDDLRTLFTIDEGAVIRELDESTGSSTPGS